MTDKLRLIHLALLRVPTDVRVYFMYACTHNMEQVYLFVYHKLFCALSLSLACPILNIINAKSANNTIKAHTYIHTYITFILSRILE